MESYWICSDCGSANEYPDEKICAVCDKPISRKEENDAQKRQRASVEEERERKRLEHQEQVIRRKREIEERIQAEFERRRREKERVQREKIEAFEKSFEKYTKKESFLCSIFYKGVKFIKKLFLCLLAVSVIAVGVYVYKDNSVSVIASEIEAVAVDTVKEIEKTHIYVTKKGNEVFRPFSNIKKQYRHLKKQMKQSENINGLTERLEW